VWASIHYGKRELACLWNGANKPDAYF